MQSSKQFVHTLEDDIRFRGAMSKLISDYAQVEISNKVKDILRMYHSSSWHSEPIIRIKTLLNGVIGPLRLGPTPSSTGLVLLLTVGYCALAMHVIFSTISPVNLPRVRFLSPNYMVLPLISVSS